MGSSKFKDLGLILLLVLILINLLLWNVFTPIFEAADEHAYYQHVFWLAHERRLPNLNNPPQQAGVMSYPPTYYLPLVPIILAVKAPSIYDPSSIQLRPDHRKGLRYQSFHWFNHSKRELDFKWNRQEWAVHLMRLVSTLWGMGTVFLVYKSALFLFKKNSLAWLSTMLVGFNPMFAHLHSTIIILPLLIFLSSLIFYWLLRWSNQMRLRHSFILGFLVGLATVTKATGLLLLPLVIGGGYWLAKKKPNIKEGLSKIVFLAMGMLISSGWYFIRNLYLYGTLLDISKVAATTGGRALMIRAIGWVNYWVGFFTSQLATFWTGYGWSAVYFSRAILIILTILMFLAVCGVVVCLRSKTLPGEKRRQLWFLIGSVSFFAFGLAVAHYRFPAFHAKDLYPVMLPIALLTITGWRKLIGNKIKLSDLGIDWTLWLTILLFVINVVYLLTDVSPKLSGTRVLF